jgi:osmotically-inducible protein OsmY
MRFKLFLAGLALSVSLLSGQGTPQDDRIYDQVRIKLANDRDVGGNAIDVVVHDGAVILKGKVQRENQKARAEHLAKKVKGVKNVTNELVVETH